MARTRLPTGHLAGGDSHGHRPCSGVAPRLPLRTLWTCLLKIPLRVRHPPATMAGCSPPTQPGYAWLRTTVGTPSWRLREVVQVHPDSAISFSRNRPFANARVQRHPDPARGATRRITWVLLPAPGRTDLEADCSILIPIRIVPTNGAWSTCLPPITKSRPRPFPLWV
jgi:hypothetical protein